MISRRAHNTSETNNIKDKSGAKLLQGDFQELPLKLEGCGFESRDGYRHKSGTPEHGTVPTLSGAFYSFTALLR